MSKFFALIDRMKYIERWGLMRSTVKENVAEHSLQVAMIAHCLGLIAGKKFGKAVNPERIAIIAMYHESSEVMTGDLPAPIKYHNPSIQTAYKELEKTACERLTELLPDELREDYRNILMTDVNSPEYKIVKAADKIGALIKCIDELKSGNKEFLQARAALETEVTKLDLEEADYFVKEFLPEFEYTLDELSARI